MVSSLGSGRPEGVGWGTTTVLSSEDSTFSEGKAEAMPIFAVPGKRRTARISLCLEGSDKQLSLSAPCDHDFTRFFQGAYDIHNFLLRFLDHAHLNRSHIVHILLEHIGCAF